MSTLPSVKYQEIDRSTVPPVLLAGAHGIILQTLFGPTDKPRKITTVDSYKAMFGGPDAVKHPYFAQVRRALAKGVTLWVQRLAMTGASAASYLYVTEKLTITAKDVGSWANTALGFDYIKGNGTTTPHKLSIVYAANPDVQEVHETAATGTIDDLIALVNANSTRVTLSTTSGYTAPAASTVSTIYLTGGTDGSFADIPAKDTAVNTLLSKFNDLTTLDSISVAGSYSKTHMENITAYAEARADLLAIFEVDPTLTDAQALTFMNTLTKKSSFVAIYYGSLLSSWSVEEQKEVSNGILLDVLGVWSYNDTAFEVGGRTKAPAGGKRGLIGNVRSFAYNMLSPARKVSADALTASGCNIVGSHPTFGPCVWGAKTRLLSNGALDNINVRRMLIDLAMQLTPIYQQGLFEPMSPKSWRAAYAGARPILEDLEKAEGIYPGWVYNGDQNVSRIEDALYNKPLDLANGIYKVKIALVPVGYIEQLEFTVLVNNVTTLFNA